MLAGPEAKGNPGFFDLVAVFRSPTIVGAVVQLYHSTAKVKPEQVRSVTIWKLNVKQYEQCQQIFSLKVSTRAFCPQRSTMTRAPFQRQRSAGRYIVTVTLLGRIVSVAAAANYAQDSSELKMVGPININPTIYFLQ